MTWLSASRFYRQLALVHRAGISIAQAVGMAGGATNGHHRQLAPLWQQGCVEGSQLADQLEKSHEEPLAVALIRAGERSGRIPEMASLVAEHYEHRMALRSLVIARLVYPLILLHVALVMPMVVKVFVSNWPLWTVLIGPACIWALALGLVCVELFSRRAGLTARLMLRPPLSFLAMPMIVANTSQVLRAGLTAGMLVPDALELAAGGCGNRAMGARLRQAAADVRHERLPNLAAALGAIGFPTTELNLLTNAEFAGKLEEVLLQVAVLAEESFKSRALWTAKIFTGGIYGLAMLAAIIVIFSMMGAYVGAINDVGREMD